VNSDLIGKYINIISRVVGVVQKHFGGQLPANARALGDGDDSPSFAAFAGLPNPALMTTLRGSANDISGLYEQREFGKALRKIMELADLTNQNFDAKKPWVLSKENRLPELNEVCHATLNAFKLLTIYLKPILPATAWRVETLLNLPAQNWADIDSPLRPGHSVQPYTHLMQRVDVRQIDALFEPSAKADMASDAIEM